MKKGILLLLLASSAFAQGQSLKEALYGGKLKNKPGTVIRKGDDLTAQLDTTSKTATADTGITKATPLPTDSSTQSVAVQTDPTGLSTINNNDTTAASTNVAASETAVVTEPAAALKDNNAIWKEYVNTVVPALKSEVMPSKKIKKGSYYVLVSYTIDTDGQTAIGDVFVSPENSYLQQQVKQRLDVEAPRLNPVLNSSGTPRKVNKKYNFTLTKE
jgi:hypothetical protein